MADRTMQLIRKLLLFFKPVQIFIQRLGHVESGFTEEYINHLLLTIKPGDILASYESGRFTSWFIKGEWDHIAIVNKDLYVVEAVGDEFVKDRKGNLVNKGGVRKIKLEEWLWKKTHVVVLRHYVESVALAASIECDKFVGKNYDYSFDNNNETFYCSEIPYASMKPFFEHLFEGVPQDKAILPIDYLTEYYLIPIANSRTKETI